MSDGAAVAQTQGPTSGGNEGAQSSDSASAATTPEAAPVFGQGGGDTRDIFQSDQSSTNGADQGSQSGQGGNDGDMRISSDQGSQDDASSRSGGSGGGGDTRNDNSASPSGSSDQRGAGDQAQAGADAASDRAGGSGASAAGGGSESSGMPDRHDDLLNKTVGGDKAGDTGVGSAGGGPKSGGDQAPVGLNQESSDGGGSGGSSGVPLPSEGQGLKRLDNLTNQMRQMREKGLARNEVQGEQGTPRADASRTDRNSQPGSDRHDGADPLTSNRDGMPIRNAFMSGGTEQTESAGGRSDQRDPDDERSQAAAAHERDLAARRYIQEDRGRSIPIPPRDGHGNRVPGVDRVSLPKEGERSANPLHRTVSVDTPRFQPGSDAGSNRDTDGSFFNQLSDSEDPNQGPLYLRAPHFEGGPDPSLLQRSIARAVDAGSMEGGDQEGVTLRRTSDISESSTSAAAASALTRPFRVGSEEGASGGSVLQRPASGEVNGDQAPALQRLSEPRGQGGDQRSTASTGDVMGAQGTRSNGPRTGESSSQYQVVGDVAPADERGVSAQPEKGDAGAARPVSGRDSFVSSRDGTQLRNPFSAEFAGSPEQTIRIDNIPPVVIAAERTVAPAMTETFVVELASEGTARAESQGSARSEPTFVVEQSRSADLAVAEGDWALGASDEELSARIAELEDQIDGTDDPDTEARIDTLKTQRDENERTSIAEQATRLEIPELETRMAELEDRLRFSSSPDDQRELDVLKGVLGEKNDLTIKIDTLNKLNEDAKDLESAIQGVERTDLNTRAQEWIDEANAYISYIDAEGAKGIEKYATELEELDNDRTAITEAIEQEKAAILQNELRELKLAAQETAKTAQAVELQAREAMRTAFRGGKSDFEDSMKELRKVIGDAKKITGFADRISSLDALAETASSSGEKVPSALSVLAEHKDFFKAADKVLKATDKLLTPILGNEKTTEVEQGVQDLQNIVGVFAVASDKLSQFPGVGAIGKLASDYYAPALENVSKKIDKILYSQHQENLGTVQHAGFLANPQAEIGGNAMFSYMTNVMHAPDVARMPKMDDPISGQFFEHRENLGEGAREELPIKGMLGFRHLDEGRANDWLFNHRDQVWSMFYGSMNVPDPHR